MNLSQPQRDVLRSLYPTAIHGIHDDDLDDVLDAWFAADHYADNPAYSVPVQAAE